MWGTNQADLYTADGNYRDALGKCGAETADLHSGEGDAITGECLVRELAPDEL